MPFWDSLLVHLQSLYFRILFRKEQQRGHGLGGLDHPAGTGPRHSWVPGVAEGVPAQPPDTQLHPTQADHDERRSAEDCVCVQVGGGGIYKCTNYLQTQNRFHLILQMFLIM